jgi:hypothetical protein
VLANLRNFAEFNASYLVELCLNYTSSTSPLREVKIQKIALNFQVTLFVTLRKHVA